MVKWIVVSGKNLWSQLSRAGYVVHCVHGKESGGCWSHFVDAPSRDERCGAEKDPNSVIVVRLSVLIVLQFRGFDADAVQTEVNKLF